MTNTNTARGPHGVEVAAARGLLELPYVRVRVHVRVRVRVLPVPVDRLAPAGRRHDHLSLWPSRSRDLVVLYECNSIGGFVAQLFTVAVVCVM